MRIRRQIAVAVLLASAVVLEGCLALAVGGAAVGATGAVVGGAARGAGALGRAVIPGDSRDD